MRRKAMLATEERTTRTRSTRTVRVENSAPKKRTPKMEARIDARVPADTKAIIEKAAHISGVTVTNFVIDKAFVAAQAVVREHETWALNRKASEAFVRSLLNPPKPNDALKAAAARYKTLVKDDNA